MHLTSLHFQNYRPFKDLPIEFKPNLNVLIGINGSGKPAIIVL
jgi:recombinational DNA repair ATPase RecF